MALDEPARRGHRVALGLRGVERRQVVEQRALQRAARLQAFDRRVGRRHRRRAGEPGVSAAASHRQHARQRQLPAACSRLERPHRHRQRGLQLALPQHQEAAAGRDRGRALGDELAGRIDERLEQRSIGLAHHALRRCTRDDRVAHRKGEAVGAADVADERGKRVSSISTPSGSARSASSRRSRALRARHARREIVSKRLGSIPACCALGAPYARAHRTSNPRRDHESDPPLALCRRRAGRSLPAPLRRRPSGTCRPPTRRPTSTPRT